MRAIVERIDSSFYMDIIVSPKDIEKIKEGEMANTFSTADGVYFYVGTRLSNMLERDPIILEEEEYEECCE